MLDLADRLRAVERAEVDLDHVIVDPGLGFAKTAEHNWRLLDGLGALRALGQPVLIGASRKWFLRKRIGAVDESPLVEQLDIATAAVSALAAVAGVYCVRVHSAKSTGIAVKIGAGWTSGADRQSIRASVNGHRENGAHTPPGADPGEDRRQAETRISRAPSP
jgi:dihydropteroate synthase